MPAIKNQSNQVISQLNNYIEEADPKIPVHLDYLVKGEKSACSIVVSNDADSFGLILSYLPDLTDVGLREIWHLYGRPSRMIPMHY